MRHRDNENYDHVCTRDGFEAKLPSAERDYNDSSNYAIVSRTSRGLCVLSFVFFFLARKNEKRNKCIDLGFDHLAVKLDSFERTGHCPAYVRVTSNTFTRIK